MKNMKTRIRRNEAQLEWRESKRKKRRCGKRRIVELRLEAWSKALSQRFEKEQCWSQPKLRSETMMMMMMMELLLTILHSAGMEDFAPEIVIVEIVILPV